MTKKYLRYSWIDPRLILGKSKIHKKGIFTYRDIKEGETVMIWGGVPVEKSKFFVTKYRDFSAVPIDDNTYLALPIEDKHVSVDEYLNHSCDPNTWLTDEVTVVARRDLKAGEEITLDSATWDADVGWWFLDEGVCTCNSPLCRQQLTPDDWKRPDLQLRYAGHFSPYIQKKIDGQSNSK